MSLSNEQLMSFIKKNPIGVGCGLLSLVLAAGIYFRGDLIPAAHAELEEKSAEADRLANNLKYSNQLKEQFDELSASNKIINARLIRAQLGVNNGYFYKIESETGAKITTLTQVTNPTMVKNAAKDSFVPVTFSLGVQGTFTQLLDFLQHLENGQHFCRILAATCSKSGGDKPDALTANLTLELLGQP